MNPAAPKSPWLWPARVTTYLMLTLTALPILAYPGVLVAGIMALAAPTGDAPFVRVVIAYSFLAGSLAYPFVFVAFTVAALVLVHTRHWVWGPAAGLGPPIYLLALAVLFALWS